MRNYPRLHERRRKGNSEMELEIPDEVVIVELEGAPFRNAREARAWSVSHGVVGVMSDIDTHGKGEIAISVNSIRKMASGSAALKSVTTAIHYAAMVRVRDIIRESFVGERHPDYTKVNGVRDVKNPVNPLVDIVVLYGCVSLGGIPYRAKTTLKMYRESGRHNKAYSYEICNIEILKGNAAPVARPNDRISMPTRILLNGVRDVNGVPLIAGGREGCEGGCDAR